jgi:uncharacterized membrane protein YeaQ/YmgE (transglycosylase-associated protein family)
MLGISIFVILIYLLIGLLIGWIAGLIMKGKGFGFLGNIVIAILGSMIGGFLFKLFGLNPHGVIRGFISAVFGAIVLLWIISLFTKKR